MNIPQKKLDIICPVYNKQDLVKDFIQSARVLPADKVNIILVNDGSTDDSANSIQTKITELALDNFYLINKINGGVSSARNEGLEHTSSDYVWFCDPDDLILPDAAKAVNALGTLDAEMLVFPYRLFFTWENRAEEKKFSPTGQMSSAQFLQDFNYFGNNNCLNTVWNRFFKRSAIGEFRFDETMHHSEDRCFVLDVLSRDPKVHMGTWSIYQHNRYLSDTLSTVESPGKIADMTKANLKNIASLDKVKNTRPEKKHHINAMTVKRIKLKEKNVYKYYVNEHKKLNIPVFPLTSVKESLLYILLVTHTYGLFNQITRK